jgi:2-C-methyl-D-erythritol 4-phosphate cytidylyltransferase
MSVTAILLAARTDSAEIDALTSIRGEALLLHAVRGLVDSQCVNLVVVIAPVRRVNEFTAALSAFEENSVRVVPALEDQASSLRAALVFHGRSSTDVDSSDEVVLIHQIERAFTPLELIRSVISAVRQGFPSVLPVLAVTDTIKHVDEDGALTNAVDRKLLRSAQTPQGFTLTAFRSLLDSSHFSSPNGSLNTDPKNPEKLETHMIPGHPLALRVETPVEVIAVEALITTP